MVTGEQHYDPKSREWKKAHWSVDVASDLANAAGVTVAHAKGKMMVDSKMLGDAPATGGQKDVGRREPQETRKTKLAQSSHTNSKRQRGAPPAVTATIQPATSLGASGCLQPVRS